MERAGAGNPRADGIDTAMIVDGRCLRRDDSFTRLSRWRMLGDLHHRAVVDKTLIAASFDVQPPRPRLWEVDLDGVYSLRCRRRAVGFRERIERCIERTDRTAGAVDTRE